MPLTTVNDVLTALRNELVAAGIVRKPANAGALPPMHVEPRGGAPAPGEREAPEDDPDVVVTISLSGDLAEAPFAPTRRTVVDVRYRSKGNTGLIKARKVDAAIRARLVNNASYGLGYLLDAAGAAPLLVLQASVFAGLGRISNDPDQGFDELAKYALETQLA